MIGPQTQFMQALYMDNPQGIVDYITNAVKKAGRLPRNCRRGMDLSGEVTIAAAGYMLEVSK